MAINKNGINVETKFISNKRLRILWFFSKSSLIEAKFDRATFLKAPGTNKTIDIHCVAAEYIPNSTYPANLIKTKETAQLDIEYKLSWRATGNEKETKTLNVFLLFRVFERGICFLIDKLQNIMVEIHIILTMKIIKYF